MDLTPLEHVGIALACTGIGTVCRNTWAGAMIGIGLFIGREHAQAEQRVIQGFYDNHRANAPWYCGFEFRAWDLGSILDWSCPAVATILAALAFTYWIAPRIDRP